MQQDHGGDLDRARAQWGGDRADWLDLSTGINPRPYPLPDLPPSVWTDLPDHAARNDLIAAARQFWRVPPSLDILPANGASALIAAMPRLVPKGTVLIPGPTYNEHRAAFQAQGWTVSEATDQPATARVIVHPNNPDGHLFDGADLSNLSLVVIDESFADTDPDLTLRALAHRPGVVVLKSFGKFWGLAGVRLGFAIARPETIQRLADHLGPWAVSGAALRIGAQALQDDAWAQETRTRLDRDALRLDQMMTGSGRFQLLGGTPLFRLYKAANAKAAQDGLARHKIWTRIFPYDPTWIRLGLPGTSDGWKRLERALADLT